MRKLLYIVCAIVAACAGGCAGGVNSAQGALNRAEAVMATSTDSALAILGAVDPADLAEDSARARYYYLQAWCHLRGNYSMIGDSLIASVHDYYRGMDVTRDLRSGMAWAWYKFWVGDLRGAMTLLDSIASVDGAPDSLMLQAVRLRVLLGTSEYQGKELIPYAKRLIELETDTLRRIEATFMLVSGYENAQEIDSALYLIDGLIDYARSQRIGDKHFIFELERSMLLAEQGRHRESEVMIADIFRKAGPDNGAADYLHLELAWNALNTGDAARASWELAMADSFAIKLRGGDDPYYRSFSNLMRAIIYYKEHGRLKLTHVVGISNRQRERFNRMEASQWESERSALQQQSRALALKAESERKTAIIVIVSLLALFVAAASGWVIIARRGRERDSEERIEALQKLLDEYNAPSDQADAQLAAALRRMMLQQLGIIKMVAETPTEQNRDMLRKISSIDNDADGELVNWNNVFEIVNNLYSGFYDKLMAAYGDVLSQKEIRIIVLMAAGFSTKEISVVTAQTTATIYVRKSSIRKKLGVPEKEDILAFIRGQL